MSFGAQLAISHLPIPSPTKCHMDSYRFVPQVTELEQREVPAALDPYQVLGATIAVQFDHSSLDYACRHPGFGINNQGLAVANMIERNSPVLQQTLMAYANQLLAQEQTNPADADFFDPQINYYSTLALEASQDITSAQFVINEINTAQAAAAANGTSGSGTTGGLTGLGTGTGTSGTGTTSTTGTGIGTTGTGTTGIGTTGTGTGTTGTGTTGTGTTGTGTGTTGTGTTGTGTTGTGTTGTGTGTTGTGTGSTSTSGTTTPAEQVPFAGQTPPLMTG